MTRCKSSMRDRGLHHWNISPSNVAASVCGVGRVNPAPCDPAPLTHDASREIALLLSMSKMSAMASTAGHAARMPILACFERADFGTPPRHWPKANASSSRSRCEPRISGYPHRDPFRIRMSARNTEACLFASCRSRSEHLGRRLSHFIGGTSSGRDASPWARSDRR